jgi:CRISPR system Cascade subunit CasC
MSSTNPLRNIHIEYHILQSFPVTCLNRDDVGAPKTAIVGGNTRARVSSQCWKRQVRIAMQGFDVKLGIRTKKIADFIDKACIERGASPEQGAECGKVISDAFSKDTLFFFSESEAQGFADYAQEKSFESTKLNDKELQKVAKKTLNPAIDGLDIALFGRMVAQASELDIEAAASFSHAISTHKVSNEVEFFTALDDLSEEQGSAHMGSLEFNSATYYRYVSLDLGQLWASLSGDGLDKAIEAFTKALFVAVPSARQTTQSGASPWEFAKIFVRKGQRLQVPFETAIKAKDGGYLQPSITALTDYLTKKELLAGSLFGKLKDFTFGADAGFSIDHLVAELKASVAEVQ